MMKLFVALLVVSLVAFVSADDDDDDFPSLLGGGDDLPFSGFFKPFASLSKHFVEGFKPPKGGSGEAHFTSTSHSEKTVNGKKVEDETVGDKVDNLNGAVSEEHTES